ncbi:MAG: aminopeptidase [Betaproteobacteria bacterium]|nr:aminopeptidase [Betaproteobacteria bacterium]
MRFAFLLLLLPFIAGCETLGYYSQAIGGQLGILSAARPVDAWLADPSTPEPLRAKLRTSQQIRDFASRELGLPDNASYRSYADLHRPYAVWNVFAAPEFSTEPRQECFPITGCVAYRGFFSEEAARRHAEDLRARGYDVYVGGVAAYSTLGWFNDPLLSTFIGAPDAQLARLIFHELAHQLVYAPSDTTFNESFAVTVEEAGVRRWLSAQGRLEDLKAFEALQDRRRVLAERVKATREQLAAVYVQALPEDEKRKRKAEEYARLRAQYPGIVPEQPNNAFLASVALYNELVPQLEALLRESGSLPAFYDKAREIARSGEAGKLLKPAKPPGPAAAAR